jgi:hypothetical protein
MVWQLSNVIQKINDCVLIIYFLKIHARLKYKSMFPPAPLSPQQQVAMRLCRERSLEVFVYNEST